VEEADLTWLRFPWQLKCAQATTGTVLNIGCAEDPAELKETIGDRVVNVDLYDDRADEQWDVREMWPYDAGSVELVVLGDIIEHLTEYEIELAFTEARRVSEKLAITAPEDIRILQGRPHETERGHIEPGGEHLTIVTDELLRRLLGKTGWHIDSIDAVDYNPVVPRGWFVEASHAM
jgi:hypothetical protein